MTVGIKIKNRRLRSLSHHHISHYARIQIRSHPKLESQRRTHIAPDLMEPCQFAIGQRVGVHDFAGEELGTLEVDMPMRFCDASNAIMRCVSEHTETPMGAISLVWERCDFVRYVVGSYSYWQLSQDGDDDAFCFVCGEDCEGRASLGETMADVAEWTWNMYCRYCRECNLCKRCSFSLPDGPCCVRCIDWQDLKDLKPSQSRWIELTDATHMSWLLLAEQRNVKAKVDTSLLLRYLLLAWADIAADYFYIWS